MPYLYPMSLRVMWGGIAAYFLLFWFAVGDLGLAVACTFFLVLFGLNVTRLTLKALLAMHPPATDQNRQPVAANLDCPPR